MGGLILARLRQIVGNAEDALRRIVERRGKDLADADRRRLTAQSQPGFQEGELPSRSERRAREHDRAEPIEEQLTQNRSEIERHGREADMLAPGSALHPSHGRGPPCCRPEGTVQAVGDRLEPAHHAAQLLEKLATTLGLLCLREPIGDRLDRIAQRSKRAES
jgi:hypothetical protein